LPRIWEQSAKQRLFPNSKIPVERPTGLKSVIPNWPCFLYVKKTTLGLFSKVLFHHVCTVSTALFIARKAQYLCAQLYFSFLFELLNYIESHIRSYVWV
jgi:hypothetical protein